MAAVAYAAWLAIGAFGRPYNFFDMKIYHGAVVWWASGHELYEFIAPATTLGFTYPPFAGLVMLPMAQLPVDGAGLVNALASIAALALRPGRRCSDPSWTGSAGRSGSPWPSRCRSRSPSSRAGRPSATARSTSCCSP